jgi:hypothetical protein
VPHWGHKACESQQVIKPTLIPIEGPEKATRGGVNESQSKFLE